MAAKCQEDPLKSGRFPKSVRAQDFCTKHVFFKISSRLMKLRYEGGGVLFLDTIGSPGIYYICTILTYKNYIGWFSFFKCFLLFILGEDDFPILTVSYFSDFCQEETTNHQLLGKIFRVT